MANVPQHTPFFLLSLCQTVTLYIVIEQTCSAVFLHIVEISLSIFVETTEWFHEIVHTIYWRCDEITFNLVTCSWEKKIYNLKMTDLAPDQFMCAYCHVQANQRCTGCHETFYCSREHQKLHWKKHKNHCCAFKVRSSL